MIVKLLIFESYLDTIKSSVGSQMFQTLWAEVDGKKENILHDGERACGVFVSGILLWFSGLIKERHATTAGTVRDMRNSGWYEIREPKIGAILHWEKHFGNGEENEHLGFYLGNEEAVSTSGTAKTPIIHHWTYGTGENGAPKRKIIAIYWHPLLNN